MCFVFVGLGCTGYYTCSTVHTFWNVREVPITVLRNDVSANRMNQKLFRLSQDGIEPAPPFTAFDVRIHVHVAPLLSQLPTSSSE